jgi:hypothetical protein
LHDSDGEQRREGDAEAANSSLENALHRPFIARPGHGSTARTVD